MGQFHWDPASYLDLMRSEVPDYERLQDEVAAATAGLEVRRALELGTGTGETARRLFARHPAMQLVGVDSSPEMLDVARSVLAADRADLRVAGIEEPLPDGPFDLVFSALCVHHLDGSGKAALFERVAAVLAPGGRLVVGDVVVPDDLADVVTPIDGVYDMPSRVDEQLAWMAAAGLPGGATWQHRDLAVLAASRPQADG
jgi:tRNA (cmo5U34)-methyltransferase